MEAVFSGTDSTFAGFKGNFLPGDTAQNLTMRITAVDGSPFNGKKGRIAVGQVGQTSITDAAGFCSGIIPFGDPYSEITIGGTVFGGIDLTTGSPFVTFGPPTDERVFAPIDVSSRTKLTISLRLLPGFATLRISDSRDGTELYFNGFIPYPSV